MIWLILLLGVQVTQVGEQSLAAVWSDKGQVEIFDLRSQLEAVHSSAAMAAFIKQQKEAAALFSFSGHMTEGFAVDWSPKVPGTWGLSCKTAIQTWKKTKAKQNMHIFSSPCVATLFCASSQVPDCTWTTSLSVTDMIKTVSSLWKIFLFPYC